MSNNDVDMADRTPDYPLQDVGLEEFRDLVTAHRPESKLAGPGNSGITCLIATIRHLLCFLYQEERNEVFQFADEAEQKHDVPENERGVLRAILHGDVQQAVEQIKAIFPEDTTCSFETLIFSDPYRRSMWNNPFFQVYLRRMLGPNAKPDGHPSSQGYQEDPHFTWDGSPGQTLTQHVAKQFGHKTKGMLGWLDKPNFPCFFALKYVSTNKDRRHYHDLSHFFMRIGQPDSPVCCSRYEAAVVVRLRDDQNGLDSLRLYGKWSTPLYELQEKLSAPWSNDWMIEQGGEFLIFYVRNDCPVEMPPSTPPEFRPYRSPESQEFYQFVIKELERARIEDEQAEQDEQDLDDADNNGSVTPKDSEQVTQAGRSLSPASSGPMFGGSSPVPDSTALFGFFDQSIATEPRSDDGDLDKSDREPAPSPSNRSGGSKDDSLPVMSSKETPRQGPSTFGLRTAPMSGQRPLGSSHGSTRHKVPLPPQSAIAPRSTQNKHQRDEQPQRQNTIKRQRVPAPAAPRVDELHSTISSRTYTRPDEGGLSRAGVPRSPPHWRRQDDDRDMPGYWLPESNHRPYFDSRPDYGFSRDGYGRDWQEDRSSYDSQGSSRGGHYNTASTRPDEYRGRSRSRSPPYQQRWRDGRGGSRY